MFRLFSTDTLDCSWRSRAWSILLVLGLGISSLVPAIAGLRIGIAEKLGDSGRLGDLQRALAIDPSNAELHRRLGMYDLYLADPPNSAQALEHLRRAIKLNPQSALYWSNLGSACESNGDRACADAAFARLLSLAPEMPRHRWVVANYYLRSDQPDEALAQFRRLLDASSELDPDSERQYAERTFEVCYRALGDPQTIFAKVLADRKDPALKLDFVDYLSGHDHFDDAYKVWTQTVAASVPFPFATAKDYLGRLLIQGRYAEAWKVWQDLERLGIVTRPPGDDPDSLVFNGGFETPPLNAGFDWHFAEVPFLSFNFADANAYRGARCLRLDFSVKRNELYQPVFQFVPVSPGQPYVLSAYVRSDGITSDTGPELRVFDPARPESLDVSTETTVDTTAWHPISVDFRPGPNTHFVMLAVRRSPSRSFPTEIAGTFWVDAISIKPASSETKASKAP